MDCGIFYGSTTGNTATVSEEIKKRLSSLEATMFDVSTLDSDEELKMYDFLIFGASTWGDGDLQDDWSDYLGKVSGIDLSNKIVAIFGLGDQEGYADCFVDGMRELYDFASESGAKIIGSWDSKDYDFDNSKALIDDRFVGLVIDEDNQGDMTNERLDKWCSSIISNLAQEA